MVDASGRQPISPPRKGCRGAGAISPSRGGVRGYTLAPSSSPAPPAQGDEGGQSYADAEQENGGRLGGDERQVDRAPVVDRVAGQVVDLRGPGDVHGVIR